MPTKPIFVESGISEYRVFPTYPIYFTRGTTYKSIFGVADFHLLCIRDYDEDYIRKEWQKLAMYALANKYRYDNEKRFVIDYTISNKPFNLVMQYDTMIITKEKQKRIIDKILPEVYHTLKYGSEVETGLLEDMLTYDIEKANDGHWYEDGSCGIEFPTPAFSDWNDFEEHMWNLKNEIYYKYGHKYFNPRYGAGGHFNVSSSKFPYNSQNVLMASLGFLPLLIYLFQKRWTSRRDSDYRYIDSIYYELSQMDEKYHWLHLKSYAYEYRFPDSLYNVDAYLTEAAIITGIHAMATVGVPVPKRLFAYQPNYYYNKMIRGEWKHIIMPNVWEEYVQYAIKALKMYLKDYFVLFESDTGIDLVSRLDKYVKKPKWRDE